MTLQLEYVNGLGLRRFILDNLTLTLDNRIKIYKNILEAFAYLHTMDVLHGDIHAGNILVKEDLSIKVIDFDMAHHNSRRRSEIISRGGVQTYIAPEKVTKNAFQVANKRADFRSEVYQLGILGYFIFIESFPFEADSWKLLAKKIKNEKPSFSENKAQIVPQKIIAFLEKSLEKVPQNRFSSAIEMNSLFLFD
jgi:serine/threonine-protein kinase